MRVYRHPFEPSTAAMSGVARSKRSEVVELLTYLSYEADTGKLTWVGAPKATPSIVVGRKAGFVRKDGYHYVRFRRTEYLSHRLCWELHYGEQPRLAIDHINGDKSDNRIGNLRLATHAQNLQNRGPFRRNVSGYKGVSFNRRSGKFLAAFRHNGEKYDLGYFDNGEEAARAYDAAVSRVHGEFAYLNFPDAHSKNPPEA